MGYKVEGFNPKQQRVFNAIVDSDGPITIAQLKKLFTKDAKKRCEECYEEWSDSDADAQAQSYVRNNLRLLVNDGWVEKLDRGTYKLTSLGKRRISTGVTTTPHLVRKQTKKSKATPKNKKTVTKKKTVAKKPKSSAKRKTVDKKKAVSKKKTKAVAKKKTSAKKKNAPSKKPNVRKVAPNKIFDLKKSMEDDQSQAVNG